MQAMSRFWLPAMQADRLEVVAYGQVFPPLAAGIPTPLATFPVVSGQVTVDAGNAIRRSLSSALSVPLQFDPYGLPVPMSTTEAGELFPDGNELALFTGCRYPSTPAYAGAPMISVPWIDGGSPFPGEVAQLGRFLMEDVEVFNDPSSGNLYVELNGSDRSATISRAKFTAPYTTDGTSTLDVQVKAMLNNQVSGLTFSFSPGPVGFPIPAQQSFSINGDPWAAAQQIAASVGYELYFDAFGVCTMHLVINPATVAPLSFYEDGESNIVTAVQRSIINTAVPNLVILTSQGSNVGPPIQSVWWDSNPNSKTFYNSTVPTIGSSNVVPPPQGTYPTTTVASTSSTATDQASNDQAAQSIFVASYGSFESIDLKIRGNWAQDVEDVVFVLSEDAGADSNYILDTITFQVDGMSEQEMKGRVVVPA